MKLILVCLILFFIATALAGYQPMATYKDEVVNKSSEYFDVMKVKAKEFMEYENEIDKGGIIGN